VRFCQHPWLLWLAALSVCCSPNPAEAEPRVIISIDVESRENLSLPTQMDAVCDDGSHCGLMQIVRMLQDRRLAGTFFLNVYEYTRFGAPALRDIAARLEAAGQDVELHTHPETVYDRSRTQMYQYSLEEQTAIIRDGARLLEDWTGHTVLAHRAGSYSADERTLLALEHNGIRVDSSMFWAQPKSHLNALNLPRNVPWQRGPLTEIPVTVYLREDRPTMLGNLFAPIQVVRKVDVNWLVNRREAETAIDALVTADIPVLVVFLHSFSFVTETSNDNSIHVDHHAVEMFQVILDHVAERKLQVITMREVAEQGLTLAQFADVVPHVPVNVDLVHYAWGRFKGAKSASLAVLACMVVLAGAGTLIVRRRRARTPRGVNGIEATNRGDRSP
jgi:peptidoglycan/xylan/chitin deacetylase (PgdA/CDA1 family)